MNKWPRTNNTTQFTLIGTTLNHPSQGKPLINLPESRFIARDGLVDPAFWDSNELQCRLVIGDYLVMVSYGLSLLAEGQGPT